jgi:hypothetical protein
MLAVTILLVLDKYQKKQELKTNIYTIYKLSIVLCFFFQFFMDEVHKKVLKSTNF